MKGEHLFPASACLLSVLPQVFGKGWRTRNLFKKTAKGPVCEKPEKVTESARAHSYYSSKQVQETA